MKFTQKLATHLTPEWRKQYINYEELKEMLITAIEKAPDPARKQAALNYNTRLNEEFLEECFKELSKVDNFYAEKLAEAKRKFAELKSELFKNIFGFDARRSIVQPSDIKKLPKRRSEEQKLAFSEFYLSLVLLQNYQNLNHTGFRKILKKHDKLLHMDSGAEWFMTNIDKAYFYTNKELVDLIQETETTFTEYLEDGDRTRAMKRLRVPPLEIVHHPKTAFWSGVFMGGMLVLFFVAYFSFSNSNVSDTNRNVCLRLFRGPFLLILFLFLIGVNIYGWRSRGVNHVLIFEIDPRDYLSSLHVIKIAVFFGFLWSLSLCGFLYHDSLGVSPYLCPLSLMLFMVLFVVNPFRICHYTSRMWVISLTVRVVCAPFHHVGFADFWLGDQMNSMVVCIVDYWYCLCFYARNRDWWNGAHMETCSEKDYLFTPFVSCLPAWFRFAQCLRRYRDTRMTYPFLVNAGKYATTFTVVLFGTLRKLHRHKYVNTFDSPHVWAYLFSYIVNTVYCYAWDMLKDFGVFAKFSGENIFLREQILYPPLFYYFAIVEDLLLRLAWVLEFFLTERKFVDPFHMRSITGVLEVFRRYIWNYFRLENEHLFNAGHFRAVRDISVVPILPKDQIKLQRMMDEVDGVTNRQGSNDSVSILKNPSRPELNNQSNTEIVDGVTNRQGSNDSGFLLNNPSRLELNIQSKADITQAKQQNQSP